MLLVIDVGNSNTVLGLYDGQELVHHFRISTQKSGTSDEYGTLILSLLERQGLSADDIRGVIMASVVPQLNRAYIGACKRYFRADPLVVGPGIKTQMPILTDQPSEVGADRIVNAVAAWTRFRGPLLVVDFGTATTFDAVNGDGAYLGGSIAPGVVVSMDALFQRAAKLPRVEIARPSRVIGKNTLDALQSGLYYGYVGLVDEIVRRMTAELGPKTKVMATGGLARLVAEESKTIHEVDDNLTLEGLRLLYGMNT